MLLEHLIITGLPIQAKSFGGRVGGERKGGYRGKNTFCPNLPPSLVLLLGLELQLYIDQANYIPGVSDAAGIRIIVHNQTYMPFPEDDGISIMPGTRTSIALQQVK